MKLNNRKDYRKRRHLRLRKKIQGTAERPRMAVFVSNSHMYVQFVDDDSHRILASVHTLGQGLKVNCETAAALGGKAAAAAQAKGILRVVVDRGGFQYHGRVKAIVEAAVAAGLVISSKAAAVVAEPEKENP
jgi:large subunit ribosomal protein L18